MLSIQRYLHMLLSEYCCFSLQCPCQEHVENLYGSILCTWKPPSYSYISRQRKYFCSSLEPWKPAIAVASRAATMVICRQCVGEWLHAAIVLFLLIKKYIYWARKHIFSKKSICKSTASLWCRELVPFYSQITDVTCIQICCKKYVSERKKTS